MNYGECAKHPGSNMVNCQMCAIEKQQTTLNAEVLRDGRGEVYRFVKATERVPEFKEPQFKQHLVEDNTTCLIRANGLFFNATYFHYRKVFEIRVCGEKTIWKESDFEKFEIHWMEKITN